MAALGFLSVVYTDDIMAGRTPALQQNWQSSEKSQHFKEKKTIFNEHPVSNSSHLSKVHG